MKRGPSPRLQRELLVASAAGVGALASVDLTGVAIADAIWCGGFCLLLAHFGGYVKRWPPLLAAGLSVVVVSGWPSVIAVGVAGIVAAVNANRKRSSSRLTAVSCAATGIGILASDDAASAWLIGAVVAGVALVVGASGLRGMGSQRRRRVRRYAIVGAASFAVCASAGVLALGNAARKGASAVDAMAVATAATRSGDLVSALPQFRVADAALRSANGALRSIGRIGRVVPGLSQQLAATVETVDATGEAVEVARRTAASIDPTALAVRAGSINVRALEQLGGQSLELARALESAARRVRDLDRRWLLSPLVKRVDQADAELASAARSARRFTRAIEVAPDLLGMNTPRRWLVLLTSPVEARNRFGFPGAFAVLRTEGGRVAFERSGAILDLTVQQARIDQSSLDLDPGTLSYSDFGVTREWRSVTIPPDGPNVGRLVRQLAAQTDLGPIDGVLLADPYVLATVLELVGPIDLPEITTTVDSSNAVDLLVRRQYVEFPELDRQGERRDLLASMAREVGNRIATLQVPEVERLTGSFGPLLAGGHLVVTAPAPELKEAAELFADARVDGAFPATDADVLFVGHRNNGGNKIDLFLERTVDYGVDISEDGRVRASLDVHLSNTAPAAGLPFYLIGSVAQPPAPNGTNRGTVLVYSRYELMRATVNGTPISPPSLSDGGLRVYQIQLDVPSGGTAMIHLELEGLADPSGHAVRVYPGGLLHPDATSVRITVPEGEQYRPLEPVTRAECVRVGLGRC